MIQCSECEYFERHADGHIVFHCDPFDKIKEPECLTKWTLLRIAEVSSKLDKIVAANESQAAMNKRLAPMQEKMFRYMEREIDSEEEADRWKTGDAEWDEEEDETDES